MRRGEMAGNQASTKVIGHGGDGSRAIRCNVGRVRTHYRCNRASLIPWGQTPIQFGVAAPRLLTAGEAFDDLVFVGLDRLPALGEEVKTDVFHATIGGGAVITAVAAARLGVPTAILSALSEPAAARLRRERVRVHNLRRAASRTRSVRRSPPPAIAPSSPTTA